jgi:ubiquinone/menaquinone biosynthesis C-methylase UbiE
VSDQAPQLAGRVSTGPEQDRTRWFLDHVRGAAAEVRSFLVEAGLSLDGRGVLDLGCGDGFIPLGLCLGSRPSRVVGTDIVATDVDDLAALSRRVLQAELPEQLSFETCTETTLPFEDASFDTVVSWSVFEHVSRPVEVLREVHRVLRPGGHLFLQIWPLYHSEHGSHLWYWLPAFEHLRRPADELRAQVASADDLPAGAIEATLVDFDTLNRMTLDRLQRSLVAAGFRITRVELLTGTTHLPEGLEDVPLVDLLVAGVKLIAVPI